jgi:hypothetical protein
MINEEGRITVSEWLVGFYKDEGIFLPEEIQLSKLEEFFNCKRGVFSFPHAKTFFEERFGGNLNLLQISLKGYPSDLNLT